MKKDRDYELNEEGINALARAKHAEEREERARREAPVRAWAATLPDNLDEWTMIDRDRLEITDRYGNHLTGLKQFYGQTPAQILTALAEMAGGWEE